MNQNSFQVHFLQIKTFQTAPRWSGSVAFVIIGENIFSRGKILEMNSPNELLGPENHSKIDLSLGKQGKCAKFSERIQKHTFLDTFSAVLPSKKIKLNKQVDDAEDDELSVYCKNKSSKNIIFSDNSLKTTFCNKNIVNT